MDLTLSDDQRLIVETAEAFLADHAGSVATRAAAYGADGIDRTLWRGIGELGWCGVHVPESFGGLGLGWVELALLLEQTGRRLACVPYFDSVALAATLLREAAQQHAQAYWLPRLASGELIAAVAEGDGCASANGTASWQLDGRWPSVGSGALANLLLLRARAADGEALLFAVPTPVAGVVIELRESIDRTRRTACVTARSVTLPAQACVARGAALEAAGERARCLAAIGLAAEQVGVAQQCLDLTVAYVKERVQFDRSLAAFQAVKHRCAQMMVAVEGARSAVYGAACVADADPDAATLTLHAAQARCEASEAAQFCAQEAIQLHGGVGFTWEYDPQLYFKRAQASSQRLGPTSEWLERVAQQLLDGAPG